MKKVKIISPNGKRFLLCLYLIWKEEEGESMLHMRTSILRLHISSKLKCNRWLNRCLLIIIVYCLGPRQHSLSSKVNPVVFGDFMFVSVI